MGKAHVRKLRLELAAGVADNQPSVSVTMDMDAITGQKRHAGSAAATPTPKRVAASTDTVPAATPTHAPQHNRQLFRALPQALESS